MYIVSVSNDVSGKGMQDIPLLFILLTGQCFDVLEEIHWLVIHITQ